MPRGNKQELILEAAEQLVRDRRYHEITLDEVAESAHVGKGTIYRYFKDKDDLFFQLAIHGHEELCSAIEEGASVNGYDSFENMLETVCQRISDFFLGRHALFRLMKEHEGRFHVLREKKREAFKEHRARLRSALAKVLGVGIASKHIRTDIPLETQAHFLLGLMRTRDLGFGRERADMPPIRMVIDIFLRGVQPGEVHGGSNL